VEFPLIVSVALFYLIYYSKILMNIFPSRWDRKLYLQYYMNHYHMWRGRFIAAVTMCLAMYWYMIHIKKNGRKSVRYAPMLDGDIEWESQLNLLYNGTEAHCINELRMRKLAFHNMCAHIRSCGLLVDTLHFFFAGKWTHYMSQWRSKLQCLFILKKSCNIYSCCGVYWYDKSIGFEFNRSGGTDSRNFNAGLDALCVLARDLIHIKSMETHIKITSSLGRFDPYFEV
jgi:hypothetical protein